MIAGKLKAALLASVLFATGADAKETVVWWDFLGGGDGVRMKKLIEDFNAAHADTIEIQATTLEWGVPFYTKVQTSAAVGEGPDVMTYHLSRLPLEPPTEQIVPWLQRRLQVLRHDAQRIRGAAIAARAAQPGRIG